jgi:cyclic pyranopterin phosphate synthase
MDKTMMVSGDSKKVIEDMSKVVDRGMVMVGDIYLLEKSGRKSGEWKAT